MGDAPTHNLSRLWRVQRWRPAGDRATAPVATAPDDRLHAAGSTCEGETSPTRHREVYRWTDWDQIAPYAALAVIAAEDQQFLDHHGFDVEAIRVALGDAGRGERLRGASTISQQTVKNLFLWPGRSVVRKALEAWLTVLIELSWSKRRILEVYLNVAGVRRGRLRHHGGQRAVLRQAPGRSRGG